MRKPVAMVGPEDNAWIRAMKPQAAGDILLIGTMRESNSPTHQYKKIAGMTTIYVSPRSMCQAPMRIVKEALTQLASISYRIVSA
jgi:uncharacterized protein YyaL (SSP411 family)